jgi:hypothetical protein
VLSGRGLCDGPIPRPEESYRVWCVIVIRNLQKEAADARCGVLPRRKGRSVKETYFDMYWLGSSMVGGRYAVNQPSCRGGGRHFLVQLEAR